MANFYMCLTLVAIEVLFIPVASCKLKKINTAGVHLVAVEKPNLILVDGERNYGN